ncbi:three-helix bundle dimerization domain-containing protein [Kribbella sp. CA-247076]|uniref:three-helix bundle dimerization domain-containing protein n=1 Tax=Kribbella sp. CA-247076 TaxID=3239941 RepID=UPI003D90B21F
MKLDTVREDKAILNVTRRLADTFSDLHSPEDVEAAVQAAHQRFTGDPVREYVPILVERIVRAELSPHPDPVAPETLDDRKAKWTRPPSVTLEATTAATATGPDGGSPASPAEADGASPADGGSPVGGAGAVGGGTPGSGTTTAGPGGSRRRVALPAAVAGVLVVATLTTIVIVRNGDDVQAGTTPATATVSGVIGSEKRAFFEDPDVQAALAAHGLAVKIDTAGSREIATSVDLKKYDFAFPSSTVAAERIQQPSGNRPAITGKKYAVFSSPMAIATYRPIANLLSATGIAKQVDGVWYFDVRRYVDLVRARMRWDNIRGNTTYPVGKRILVTTTDPRTSNSAAMFLSIASYVANGDTVVQGAAAEKKVLPLVAPLFVNQGYTDSSSEGPFDDYLSLGMGKTPLVCIYEAQFVEAAVREKLSRDMVLMYPSPTVQSKHTLLSLTPQGEKLGEVLTTDEKLQQLAARHGFRTADAAQFAEVVAEHRVPVAEEIIDVADTPTYETLEHLLDGVSKSYR